MAWTFTLALGGWLGWSYHEFLFDNYKVIIYSIIASLLVGGLYATFVHWPKIVRNVISGRDKTFDSAEDAIRYHGLYPSKYIGTLCSAVVFWPIYAIEPFIFNPISTVVKNIVLMFSSTMHKITARMVQHLVTPVKK